MTKVDEILLLHGNQPYDPQKAREYYLRTRELKGRKKGTAEPVGQKRIAKPKLTPQQKRAATEAKVAKLKKRLEHLKKALAELVAAAKKRSGVETPTGKDAKGSSGSSDSKMSVKQKREAAARSKAYYEKNKDKAQTPDEELKALTAKIKEIRAKIKKAIADAKKNSRTKSQTKTAMEGR